ncbi:hypothetical protein HOBO_99 [Bacillus phage Hobo]|uniref:Tail fiber n=2 Tax=Caeruleovirus BM15 TaxID=1985178 RepID=A0A0S2MUI4_9CAUD|nr:glycerophosphoryl diester phosphodiesterase [Bacillus phage BM15]ALO79506.1 hypothetical protein BM10_102 [Bacillus phage BM15]AXQ66860.1 hypothetical protein HOBO_99 [Bacillus phage Hobo]
MEDFDYTPLSSMRFQAQLGSEVKRMYKEGENVIKLSLARVTKVNYKYNTVEVMTTLHKNSTSKNPSDNGKYSARLPVMFGGRTPEGKVYGSNTIVTVGSLVLIGFLEGNKDHPIVLNIYGDADNQSMLTRTTMTGGDESDEAVQRELWQLFTLYPSMTYQNIDGRGNKEVTFSGKSFMYITDSDPGNEYVQDGAFDYADLPSSRYANGELIEPTSPNSPTVLYVHQGIYDNHRVTFFLKSDGTLRVGSRHRNGKGITYQEMKTDGSFSIVQKHDTTDPEEISKKFSKFEISENGDVTIQSLDHKLTITKDGVLIDGKPIGSGGGGGDLEIIKDLQEKVEGVTTQITMVNGKLDFKIDKIEIEIDLDTLRQEQQKVLDGIREKLDGLSSALKAMKDYTIPAFEDGTVTADEKKKVNELLNAVGTEKNKVDEKYSQVISDPFLPATHKDILTVSKGVLDSRHQALLNTIEIVMLDGVITPDERIAVAQAFDGYEKAIAALDVSFKQAMDSILEARIKEAQENAMKYRDTEMRKIGSQITQLADSITAKVSSEQLSKEIEDVRSEMATKEEQKEIKDTAEQAQKDAQEALNKVPHRIMVGSTNGLIFKNNEIDSVVYARVYKGDEEVTTTIPKANFFWTRISEDENGDIQWEKDHVGVGSSFRISKDDVPQRATFECDVEIPES